MKAYAYDLTTNMFSRGNISEKVRFAKLDVTDEVVIDLFVGIGYCYGYEILCITFFQMKMLDESSFSNLTFPYCIIIKSIY